MTFDEAYRAGIMKLRLANWARGEYLELLPGPDGDGYAAWGRLHSILNHPDVPAPYRVAPQDVPLWVDADLDWLDARELPAEEER